MAIVIANTNFQKKYWQIRIDEMIQIEKTPLGPRITDTINGILICRESYAGHMSDKQWKHVVCSYVWQMTKHFHLYSSEENYQTVREMFMVEYRVEVE